MNKSSAPNPALGFLSEAALNALTTTIEQSILQKIQQDPQKYFPDLTPKDTTVYLTTQEVAKRLRTTATTVRNLCHKGKIRHSRPAGRSIMITEEDFKHYEQSVQNSPNE